MNLKICEPIITSKSPFSIVGNPIFTINCKSAGVIIVTKFAKQLSIRLLIAAIILTDRFLVARVLDANIKLELQAKACIEDNKQHESIHK